MWNRLLPFALAVQAILLAACGCSPKESESLTVTLHPQETPMWCWAASAQMVMDYLGHDKSQCEQANQILGRNDCCNLPVPNDCDISKWPEFDKYSFSYSRTNSAALSWGELKAEICANEDCGGRPFCFTWIWSGGGAHMMVAFGYKTTSPTTGETEWVEVYDPTPVNVGAYSLITYRAYVSDVDHNHGDDFYHVKYQGGN